MARPTSKVPEFRYKKPRIPKSVLTGKVAGSPFIKAFINLNYVVAVNITNQIVKAVRDAAQAAGKPAEAAAINKWRMKLYDHVLDHITNHGGDWPADRTKVLSVAGDMGTIAALLAGSHGTEAKEKQLKAAFAACKAHNTCSTKDAGGGDWCTFSWL